MMMRRFKDMTGEYKSMILNSSGSVTKLPDPHSHIHVSVGNSSNFDPDIFAKVFSQCLDEDLRRRTIEANKSSMDQSLAQKPVPKRRMKI